MKQDNRRQQKKPPEKVQIKKAVSAPKSDLLTRMDQWFEANQRFWIFFILGLAFLVGLLVFDIRVSDGGDDSSYILRAYEFIHEFTYPGFQGALYPMILSVFVLVFGVNLFVLKLLSLFFFLGSVWVLYKAGKGVIPASLLLWVLLITVLNCQLQFYSSQTYSEPLYMLLQSILFLIMWRYFIREEQLEMSFRQSYKKFLILGLILFLVTLTRSIAFAAIGAVLVYFLFTKQWKSMLYATLGFLVYFAPYTILKKLIWSEGSLQFSGQLDILLHKDPYNFSKGTETLAGFGERLLSNTNNYLSKIFFAILGADGTDIHASVFRTILVLVLFAFAFYWVFRKNKALLFTGLYLLAMMFTTFLLLQKMWQQERHIIVYYPLLLIFILGGFYLFTREKKFKGFQFLLPVFLSLLTLFTIYKTMSVLKLTLPNLEKQMQGNIFFGITPDYANFIKINQWAGKNLPGDSLIASRKPEISFIYSERKAYGIRTLPFVTRDSLLKILDPAKKYMIIDGEDFDKFPGFDSAYPSLSPSLLVVLRSTKSAVTGDTQSEHDYGLYEVDGYQDHSIIRFIKEQSIPYFQDVRSFLARLDSMKANVTVYDPEKLLEPLRENKVKYIILASFRVNKAKNDGRVINTIQRYCKNITFKYPTLFREIQSIGNDEKSYIVLIDWKVAQKKNPEPRKY